MATYSEVSGRSDFIINMERSDSVHNMLIIVVEGSAYTLSKNGQKLCLANLRHSDIMSIHWECLPASLVGYLKLPEIVKGFISK